MKRHYFFLTATTAALTYLLVSKRKELQQEIKETIDLANQIKDSYQTIQEQVALLASYQAPLQKTLHDFQYKQEVYRIETKARLKEIQSFTEKYFSTT